MHTESKTIFSMLAFLSCCFWKLALVLCKNLSHKMQHYSSRALSAFMINPNSAISPLTSAHRLRASPRNRFGMLETARAETEGVKAVLMWIISSWRHITERYKKSENKGLALGNQRFIADISAITGKQLEAAIRGQKTGWRKHSGAFNNLKRLGPLMHLHLGF